MKYRHTLAYYYDRGFKYQYSKQTERALIMYSEALKIYPEEDYLYFARGNTYLDKKEYKKAITDFMKCLDITPIYTSAFCSLCQAYSMIPEMVKMKDCQKKYSELSADLSLCHKKVDNVTGEIKYLRHTLCTGCRNLE